MAVFKEKDGVYEILEENCSARMIKGHEGSLMMVEVLFENYYESAAHTHVHEQMTYCLEGEFEFYVDGKTEVITVGDTIYFPSGIEHHCKALTEKARLLDVFTPIREDFLK